MNTYKIARDQLDIKKIAESGQVFRMYRVSDNNFYAVHMENVIHLRYTNGRYEFTTYPEDFENIWRSYFDLDTDYNKINREIDHRDLFLYDSYRFANGIRILHQDPWEAALCFIISQNNNIPRITSSVRGICERFGKNLTNGLYSIPRPEVLAQLSAKDELDGLGLGYRDEYIFNFVKNYDVPAFLNEVAAMPYEKAMKELTKVKGIGKKVANCICLYGLHMLDACPVDVWVKRIIDEEYGGRMPEWISSPYAGVYQQYAFYYKRTN